jgi:hypothetical protein
MLNGAKRTFISSSTSGKQREMGLIETERKKERKRIKIEDR